MALLQFRRPILVTAANLWSWSTATETWGTYKAVLNLSSIKITPQTDDDEMMVYGAVEHLLSVLTAAEVECQFGGIQSDAYAMLTGRTVTSSGSGDAEVRGTDAAGGAIKPYVALGVRLGTDGGGDLHAFFPRLMLMGDIPIELTEKNAFVKPTLKLKAARLRKEDNTTYNIWYEREHPVVTALPTVFATAIAALA